MREFADGPMLTRADIERCWGLYRGDAARDDDPDVAPLLAADWPASRRPASRSPSRTRCATTASHLARSASRTPQTRVFDGMVHGFLRWGGVVDATRDMIAWLTAR